MKILRIYICAEWSEEHNDIKLITTEEKDAQNWVKHHEGYGPIHTNYTAYELQGTEFIEVKS